MIKHNVKANPYSIQIFKKSNIRKGKRTYKHACKPETSYDL